jgi:uncharacterized secreted protein with C-terminal beta-propeller domain
MNAPRATSSRRSASSGNRASRRRTATIAGLLTVAGVLAGCTSDGDPIGSPSSTRAPGIPDRPEPGELGDLDDIVFASALRQVGDCDALLAHLRTEASRRVGPYGLGGGPMYYATDGGMAMPAAEQARGANVDQDASAAAPDAAGGGDSSASYSTTNVQESGVDEPDIVKTDGTRIVTVANGVLSVVDAATGQRTGATRLADDTAFPTDLLLVGDKAIVFGSAWIAESTTDDGGDAARTGIWNPGRQLATITEIDLSGGADPILGVTLRADGWYVTSRLTDGTVRVVLRSEPTELPFVYPQSEAGEDRAEEVNRAVVEESTLEDWLPSYELSAPDGAQIAEGLLAPCEQVDAPTEFAGFGTLSVLTFDTGATLGDGDAVSVLASGETVYASTDRLYVATNSYIDPLVLERDPDGSAERWNEDYSTSIHAFDVAGADPAEYLASGSVPGYLINQFAMSEQDGRLRAATTKGVPWSSADESESLITVLEQQGDALAAVGQVGDMGEGERIYSVRYAGDVAYVVTFRQTDPFYTVDLSDPTAPHVVGELEIPGFSSYLHPIGDGLVIGVGQDADEDGRTQGTKVSLFDVTDLAAPAEVATWTLPNSGSAVEWDHHAFLWWPATKQLVLPVNQWSPSGDFAAGFFGAVVLTVDRSGITEVGRVEHESITPDAEEICGKPMPIEDGAATGAGSSEPSCVPSAMPDQIQRSLVIDGDLWTLGQYVLQANALADLAPGAVVRVD